MRKHLWVTAAALLAVIGSAAAGTPLVAQQLNPACAPGNGGNTVYSQDACQKASDIFQYLAPQIGVALAGGNAVLGQGGTLGGLGHIYVSVRANVLKGSIPKVDAITPSVNGPQSDQYPTQSQILAVPMADAAIGIFRGIPLGVTNVGGVDLLLNGTYLPSFRSGTVDITEPNGAFKFGAGVRLGIIQEGLFFPGIAATYVRRQLPTIQMVARSGNDTLRVDNAALRADSWRVVASKNLLIVSLAAGVGQDRYHSDALVRAYVAPRALGGTLATPPSQSSAAFTQSVTRTTYFVDATLNIPIITLIGEIGEATGGTVSTYNTFAGTAPNAARLYGSLGLRLGF